ncbi:hypothetical protein FS837_000813, partial [Tulasnella sp. UAMH 9824]
MAGLPPSYNAIHAPDYTAGPPDALPAYDERGAPSSTFIPSPTINGKLPNHFKINGQYVKPQVMPSDLQAHLVLLGAFHRLREEVRTVKGTATDIPMQPDERYAVFLQRAVYRFEQWAVRMIGGEGSEEEGVIPEAARLLAPSEVPPLDVTMVWHTYMLNPRTYYEDCIRRFPGLLKVGHLNLQSTRHQNIHFLSYVPVALNPILFHGSRTVAMDMLSADLIIPVTNTLGVRKFYDDMERNTIVGYQIGVPVETQYSQSLSAIVIGARDDLNGVRAEELGTKIGWTMKDVEAYCRAGILDKRDKPFVPTPRPLNIILSAYQVPGTPSVDLASAVIRQMNFTEKMVQLGFTEPGRWEDDNDTLTRCVVRYHHFLDLMSSAGGKFAVPTLDIDLAWHTHQLKCESYRKLKDIVGIVPDHDDKVNQGALSDAYDKTAETWKERFGVPYSVCGCLPPVKALGASGTSNSGFSIFSKKGKSKAAGDKPFENARPDMTLHADDTAEQTHPSDHNAVAIINPAETNMAQAQVRRRELAKRAKELGKSVDKGKADQWGELMHKRMVDHTPSFLCPVQYGAT